MGKQRVDRRDQEPAKPTAFATTLFADPVHAVVPVAGADQWQSVRTELQTDIDGPCAVFVQRGGFTGHVRAKIRIQLPGFEHLARQERDIDIKHRSFAADGQVMTGDIRQPQPIVGHSCADACTRRWQPPVLDIPFGELSRRRQQDVFARKIRPCHAQCHDVLQLVSIAECATGLVERRACPQAAGRDLIQQPVIEQHVERRIWRLHLENVEQLIPHLRGCVQGRIEIDLAIFRDERLRGRRIDAFTEQDHDVHLSTGRQCQLRL